MMTRSKKNGFTLIEIIFGIAVISLISIAVFAFSRTVIRNSSLFQTSISTKNQVRKVFKDFTSEVRSSTYAWNGTYVIESASSTAFTFYANIDNDKYTERISYYLNGDKIIKQTNKYNISNNKYDIGTTTKIVLNYVNYSSSTPIFKYYDSGYDGTDAYANLGSPIDIAKVRLVDFVIINNEYGKILNSKDVSEVKVSIRNLKDNY